MRNLKLITALLAVGMISMPIAAKAAPSTYKSTGTVYFVESSGERTVYTDGFDTLCNNIGNEINLNPEYVKAVALCMNPTYVTRDPDWFEDASLRQLTEMEVKKYPLNTEETAIRGSQYCLPDALYTVSLRLKELVDERTELAQTREEMQALYPEAREKVIFYEAFEELYSKDKMPLENIVKIYTEILKAKNADEYVVDITDKGIYTINNKFKPIFGKYDIPNTYMLAIAMSLDYTLMKSASEFAIKERTDPYTYGLTSRENMMLAACGLVGKVRYVWGGGHGVHNIQGYNPIWFAFNDLYKDNQETNISPDGTWCPIHGSTGVCSDREGGIRTVSDYRTARESVLKDSPYWSDIQSNLSKVFPNEVISTFPISIHRIEGLDCSGFCSWLYNQIDSTRVYDSSAANFIANGGLTVVDKSERLKPGDIVSCSYHVVTIVGEAKPNVYIAVESTAYTVKLGVYYFSGASRADINYAEKLAKEYNKKLGNIDQSIYVSRLNMDHIGVTVGRLPREFTDETKVIYEGKTITEMSASEILEYITAELPSEYIWGDTGEDNNAEKTTD